MYTIIFYVPEEFCEKVKNAMFAAGAGKIGPYACCAWQVLGEGQFIPLPGSHAFIGEKNQLEKVPEFRVEMVSDEHSIHDVIAALKNTHPYEQPAYHVMRFEEF